MAALLTIFGIFILLAALAAPIVYWQVRKIFREQKNFERGLKMVPLLIHLPPQSDDTEVGARDVRDVIDENISQAQVMYNIIAGTLKKGLKSNFYGQRHFTFEIVGVHGFVYLYVTVPIALMEVIKQAIISAYPATRIEEVAEHNIFSAVGKIGGTVGGELTLKENFAYPIATYQDLKRDALQSLLNSLATLENEDGVGIQLLMRPANPGWTKEAKAVSENKRKGGESGNDIGWWIKQIGQAFVKPPEDKGDSDRPNLSSLDQAIVDSIEDKTRYPGYEVLIRVIASSNISHRAQAILENVVASFALFDAPGKNGTELPPMTYLVDFADVVGQARAKRALEIAAAGGHNILMNGAPGTGKSMLAKALPTIMPPMNMEEVLEVTHLHSLASKEYERIITERPFRSPHHSASPISVIGGGQYPSPGEVSLAHHGVLMFDEFPEFGRSIIEALRQPLEDRVISVARAKDNVTFPANFMLVATCNPCPCGYYGTSKPCICLPHHISKYHRKLSGPILDRIDLYVDVNEVKHDTLLSSQREETSNGIQERVVRARDQQLNRYKNPLKKNANLSNREIKRFIKLSAAAEQLLNQAAQRMDISPRSYMRVLRVAQTIADLADEQAVDVAHVGEALQYRRPTQSPD